MADTIFMIITAYRTAVLDCLTQYSNKKPKYGQRILSWFLAVDILRFNIYNAIDCLAEWINMPEQMNSLYQSIIRDNGYYCLLIL